MGKASGNRSRVLVLLALALTAFLAFAGSASAWTRGNVWINFASTNCPAGGRVDGIYWVVDNYSAGPPTGDWGDNVIYPSVRIGANNTISYEVKCRKWIWYVYAGKKGQRSLSPYRSGLSYTYY